MKLKIASLFCVLALIPLFFVFASSDTRVPTEPEALAMNYIGSWQSPPGGGTSDSELGPARHHLTLHADGRLESTLEIIDSPGGDGTIAQKGRYVVEGNRFTSAVIDRGEPCKIAMQGDQLILIVDEDEVYRFQRVKK